MGIYGEDKDYEELFSDYVSKSKTFFNLSKQDALEVKSLLEKKEKIRKKNGFFATFQINSINKKIEKIKNISKQ